MHLRSGHEKWRRTSGRKVKGTIHWVSEDHAEKLDVRLYDRLFTSENPADTEEGKTFLDYLNDDSLRVVTGFGEPCLGDHAVGDRVQFERLGYFVVDQDSEEGGKRVFNRIVTLRDTWGKMEAKGKAN